jgi:hypothetical protein
MTSIEQQQTPEQKIENNWNGLLWNDYLNCDGSAAEDLWAAERDQLGYPADPATIKAPVLHISIVPKSQSPQEKARARKEHELETNGNGLLLNDYINCDSAAANDLWEAERQELETPEEVAKEKKAHSPRDELERKLETNGNGLLWNDYLNCDASSAEGLWGAERKELDRVTSFEKEGCVACSKVHRECHCQKHELQREVKEHPEEQEETHLNLHPRRSSLHQIVASASSSPTEDMTTRRGAWL